MPGDIAYQNKDIASKKAAEYFKNKSLAAYGLDLPRIVDVKPTNLPAIKANELRLDNLFAFEDGSVGIIDYESDYDEIPQKLKYLNYAVRVAERYRENREALSKLHIIVIYTSDVERRAVKTMYDIGCVRLEIEPAFLSELDAGEILPQIRRKIQAGEKLDEVEQMRLIILPLAKRSLEGKLANLRECIELAKRLDDEDLGVFLLSAILVFSDKIIDDATAAEVRGWIQMTKVARIFEEEKRQALLEKDEEMTKVARIFEEEKRKALLEKDEALLAKDKALLEQEKENRKALLQKDEENKIALLRKDEENRIILLQKEREKENALQAQRYSIARNLMLSTQMSDDEIVKIVDVLSPAEVRELRQKLAG